MTEARDTATPGSEVRADLRELYAGWFTDQEESRWLAINAAAKAANIMRLAAAVPHRRIVEIGAGNGAILQRLDEAGFGDELTALEIAAAGVEAIRRRKLKRLVEAELFDGAHMPYPDRSFDLAILSHVVEHLEHPRQLLYEAGRVADYVFVEVPLEDNARMPLDFELDPSMGHVNFYNRGTIRRLLQSSGLRVLAQSVTNQPREVFTYSHGAVGGVVRHTVRQLALRVAPPLARRVFCYNSSLLATSRPPELTGGATR